MPYTLWSHNRLLGETDLGFIYRPHCRRTGWFHPNELGEKLMPAATGVAQAMRYEFTLGPDPTLHADVLAACDAEEALELELRGPDGKRIATENIGIIDTHYLLSIPANDLEDDEDYQLTPEQQAEVDEWIEEWEEIRAENRILHGDGHEDEEEVELPRYQIQVQLVHDWSVP